MGPTGKAATVVAITERASRATVEVKRMRSGWVGGVRARPWEGGRTDNPTSSVSALAPPLLEPNRQNALPG
jgi:hypothetical protein